MPPVGKLEASGSPWISSLPENSAIARAVADRAVERVVLLGGRAGQRLEPVRVVGRPVLERPLLHRLRDRVGERGVELGAAGDRRAQLRVDVLGQALALLGEAEDVGAEDLVADLGQVSSAEGLAVGAPLSGGDVVDTGPWHSRVLLESRG